ncbi:HNH endonuclease [Lentzea sp. NPDC004782]|uniref:HNH endonuclease n=1 Tax=Lentzea sp. NPDC004782 TaxID=3154458 RepID=UPI0033BC51BB
MNDYPVPKRRMVEFGPIREYVELCFSVPGFGASDIDLLAAKLSVPSLREPVCDDISISLNGPASFDGELEGEAWVHVRREQVKLRKILTGDGESACCAICGDRYPLELLVAAHIKKRSLCSEEERRDLFNVAMLACVLGCDALYEAGWITVSGAGYIQTADSLEPSALKSRLIALEGKRCTAHSAGSEQYFAWHRSTVFRA